MASPKEEKAEYPKDGWEIEQDFGNDVSFEERFVNKTADSHGQLPEDQR